jgi:hypothetical protein
LPFADLGIRPREDLVRALPSVSHGLFGHRHQIADIGGVGVHVGGLDHLMHLVDHGLRVVTLGRPRRRSA